MLGAEHQSTAYTTLYTGAQEHTPHPGLPDTVLDPTSPVRTSLDHQSRIYLDSALLAVIALLEIMYSPTP